MALSNLARDILSQPSSLLAVIEHQRGDGAEALAKAAALLRSAKRVVITGMGASLFASIPLEYSLCSAGIHAVTVEAGEFLHYRHQGLRDAVAVVVSRSGESIEIARILKEIKGRMPIIGVSNEPQSSLARNAEISISIGSLADEYVAIQTYTGTLFTFYLLAAATCNDADPAKRAEREVLPAFAGMVQRSMSGTCAWDDFLNPEAPVYLLARGPSCASAYEGALLFNEVAKSPAIGMAAASFRHGPVEVVDSRFRGFIFAPHGNTEHLNRALARDLERFGGGVRVIGPVLPGSAPQPQLCEIPAVPESLAPLFEIVPVQAAALRMSELRGIRPGVFCYAPQVAVDEASFGLSKES